MPSASRVASPRAIMRLVKQLNTVAGWRGYEISVPKLSRYHEYDQQAWAIIRDIKERVERLANPNPKHP